jgi:hypothetical protein
MAPCVWDNSTYSDQLLDGLVDTLVLREAQAREGAQERGNSTSSSWRLWPCRSLWYLLGVYFSLYLLLSWWLAEHLGSRMDEEGGERRCDKYVSGEGMRGELVEGAAPSLVDFYTSKGTLRRTMTAVRRDTNQVKLCTKAGKS